MQTCLTHPGDNQIHREIFYNDTNLRTNGDKIMNNNEDVISEKKFLNKRNQVSNEIKKVIESYVQNKNENKIKNKNEVLRGNKELKKNFNLDIQKGLQTFPEVPDSKIIGRESYQISPKALKNFQIFEGEITKLLLKI